MEKLLKILILFGLTVQAFFSYGKHIDFIDYLDAEITKQHEHQMEYEEFLRELKHRIQYNLKDNEDFSEITRIDKIQGSTVYAIRESKRIQAQLEKQKKIALHLLNSFGIDSIYKNDETIEVTGFLCWNKCFLTIDEDEVIHFVGSWGRSNSFDINNFEPEDDGSPITFFSLIFEIGRSILTSNSSE